MDSIRTNALRLVTILAIAVLALPVVASEYSSPGPGKLTGDGHAPVPGGGHLAHTGQENVPPDDDVPPPCRGDVNLDGNVDVLDLVEVITAWGPCSEECLADIDEDGDVGALDLIDVILNWGFCPST